jgi:ribonuclease HII
MYRNLVEAGCDEAGRGCLAGPVFAAAVILPKNYRHPVLNDSKQLGAKLREELREEIINTAIGWSVSQVSNGEIDEMNILRASIKAMHLALEGLSAKFQFILVDGNRFFPYKDIKHATIVKGDSLYFSIAAASILAKTFRDDFMDGIDTEFPEYGWKKNKGYATRDHRKAIEQSGITKYHRRSFTLLDPQLNLDF